MKTFFRILVFILLTVVLFFICKPGFIYLSDHATGIPVAKYAGMSVATRGFPLAYYSSEADIAPGQYGNVAVGDVDLNVPGWALVFDNIFDWILVAFLSFLILKVIIFRKKNEKL